jgi:hypothetical protein
MKEPIIHSSIHPSIQFVNFHSHPFKWIMDERFINLILQTTHSLVTKVIILFFCFPPNGSKSSIDVEFSLVEHA